MMKVNVCRDCGWSSIAIPPNCPNGHNRWETNVETLKTNAETEQVRMNPWRPETDPFILRRVGKTGEELSELAKVCFRIVIQGINGIDPTTQQTNISEMVKEMADVMAQIEINVEAWELDVLFMSRRIQAKKALMAEWEALVKDVP